MTRLRLLRDEKRMLQKEVAAALNVSQATYSSWETGRYLPDLESLFSMARMYDASLDYILGYSTIRQHNPGDPDRLMKEYLFEKHGINPSEEQYSMLKKLLSLGVSIMFELTK